MGERIKEKYMSSLTAKKISSRLFVANKTTPKKTSNKSPQEVFGLLVGKSNDLPANLSEKKHKLMKRQ